MALPTPGPDRTCLVTGASSGIGADLARELARRGHGVTLVARREGPLRDLATELAGAHRIRAEVATADLSDEDERTHLITEVDKRGLVVDVLVNNAGFSTMGPVHKSEPARELAMLRTDVEAVVHLCSALLPGMVGRHTGAVLNVASTAAFQPLPGQAGYGGAKAFVLSYSQAIAEEVRKHGVTVTVLCPGPVETGFAEVMGLTDEEAGESLPKFMWLPSREVAAQAIEGLAKGRGVVIPGTPNRVSAGFARVVPRRLLLPILASRHPSLRDR
jgi:short-subunit dehydrogenase